MKTNNRERFETQRWRIEEIYDTRVFDWSTGKPDPATGDSRECDCCGREIVIHAHVYNLTTGEKAVIGTECCKSLKLRNHIYDAGNKNYWKRSKPIRFAKRAS